MSKGYSLHIGINKVDQGHYGNVIKELTGCNNDANYYSSLAESMNCRKINRLLESDATSGNLKNYFQEYAAELVPGDLFFMTYSGHGGSVTDLNGDEEDARGNDETWCMYDRQFIDDELFTALKQFQPGVKIFMISDSCHSGTVHRHVEDDMVELMDAVEMREMVEEDQEYIERYIPKATLDGIYLANRSLYDSIVLESLFLPDDPFSSYMILLGACQDNETAKEYKALQSGVFTTAVKRVLAADNGQILSIQDLFDAVQPHIPVKNRAGERRKIQKPNLVTYGDEAFDFLGERLF